MRPTTFNFSSVTEIKNENNNWLKCQYFLAVSSHSNAGLKSLKLMVFQYICIKKNLRHHLNLIISWILVWTPLIDNRYTGFAGNYRKKRKMSEATPNYVFTGQEGKYAFISNREGFQNVHKILLYFYLIELAQTFRILMPTITVLHQGCKVIRGWHFCLNIAGSCR